MHNIFFLFLSVFVCRFLDFLLMDTCNHLDHVDCFWTLFANMGYNRCYSFFHVWIMHQYVQCCTSVALHVQRQQSRASLKQVSNKSLFLSPLPLMIDSFLIDNNFSSYPPLMFPHCCYVVASCHCSSQFLWSGLLVCSRLVCSIFIQ